MTDAQDVMHRRKWVASIMKGEGVTLIGHVSSKIMQDQGPHQAQPN